MAEPFLAEIRLFPYDRVPSGWAPCNGQIMNITPNQALFSLLGTTYGGNGTTTFALPNLQGRVPVGFGSGPAGTVTLGQVGGEENHVLTLHEMPAHNHLISGSTNDAAEVSPEGKVWAKSDSNPYAANATGLMNQAAIGMAGANQGHQNMQPYNVLMYCIALQGIYPSRN